MNLILLAIVIACSAILIAIIKHSQKQGEKSRKRFRKQINIISDPGDEVEHIYNNKKK
jgi:hypothetical protein